MIELVLTSLPIDEAPGRMVLATFCEDQRPLKGSVGLIDWRLNGKVSDLILKNHITGEFADSLMMPSQGRLVAKEILLFGLGKQGQLSEERFEQIFPLLIQKVIKLKSRDLALTLGDLSKDFMGWRTLLRSFVGSLALQHGRDDYRVLCAENTKWVQEAKRRNMDFGPEVAVSYA